MQQFQQINTVNKREMWNWGDFRLLPLMVIYFPLLCGLTGMLPVSFYSQEMWTSISQYLSLDRQALTSPFVISRWTKQKKIADVYREIIYLVISKEHFHLVFMEKFCCFRSPWAFSIWVFVKPGDNQCLSAHVCWALCLLSKFYQCQKLRNGNLCLLEQVLPATRTSAPV